MEHAVPTTGELVEEVQPATDGRVSFLARVAANVLAMVERELEYGPASEAAHRKRLAALGVADDAELAERIRTGALDDRLPEVVSAVRATAVDRLRIANPRWLTFEDAAGAESGME